MSKNVKLEDNNQSLGIPKLEELFYLKTREFLYFLNDI